MQACRVDPHLIGYGRIVCRNEVGKYERLGSGRVVHRLMTPSMPGVVRLTPQFSTLCSRGHDVFGSTGGEDIARHSHPIHVGLRQEADDSTSSRREHPVNLGETHFE